MNHHPDVMWISTSVKLSLLTHSAEGITHLDVELARTIDEVAGSLDGSQIFGE